MEAFIRVTPWSSFQSEPSESPKPSPSSSPAPVRRGFGHFRSLSSITTTKPPSPSQSPNRQPQQHSQVARARAHGRSPSVSQLPDFKMPLSFSSSPSRSSPLTPADDESDLSTLPDPRNRVISSMSNHDGTASEADLEPRDELTTLSTKLIQAINHQSTLDNALSSARQDLDQARERIRELESLTESQRELLAGDVWVRRKTMDAEKRAWATKLVEEKRLRGEVEREKRKIELELENLTAALFEEANKMVVSVKEEAHKQQGVMERKNDQLRSQIADTEALLRNQQEQLAELKLVMEQITAERDERMTSITTPSSPGFVTKFDSREIPGSHRRVTSVGNASLMLSSPTVAQEPLSPASPTTFAHLIQPVLRTDVTAYEDFQLLCRAGRNRAGSRTSSSSLSGITVGNLNLNSNSGQNGSGGAHHSPSPSTSSLPTGLMSSPQAAQPPSSLKETKFYKRVLVEDIEPTLRLDAAPSISWLARRSVLSAVTEGTLVVEPAPSEPLVPGAPSPLSYACSLCGEARKDGVNPRTHRFRTSESETASRYPLCGYCLGRVRSTCDFLGFLRIVKDGLWRHGAEGGDEGDAEKAAWEESVRLREGMFWARIGGGVVPVSQQHLGDGSPRVSCEKEPPAEVPAPTAADGIPVDAADEHAVKEADEGRAKEEAGEGAATPAPEPKPEEKPEEQLGEQLEEKRPTLEINVQTPADTISEKNIPSPPGAFPAAMRAV